MTRLFVISIAILVLAACKKEKVVFNATANEEYVLPMILEFDGQSCLYDAQRKSLKYSIDEASLSNFSPYVEFQDYSIVAFEGQELKNHKTNDLGTLELNKVYTVEVETMDEVNEFTLIFTSIPLVQLVIMDPIVNEPKTMARITMDYPDAEMGSVREWIGIEHRGASSLYNKKKSYGFELFTGRDMQQTLFGSFFDLNPNNKWILDAMYIDAARLRNKASFELWGSMGDMESHARINANFVEVYINHESQGLYSFNEVYTPELLGLTSESVLYTGTDNSTFTHFREFPETTPKSVFWEDWEQKYPNPSEQIVWNDFEELSRLIVESSDATFRKEIGNYIDLDNVIDYFVFVNVSGAIDDIGKNWHFLKRNQGEKFMIVPWDLDAAWGRDPFALEFNHLSLITNGFFERLTELDPDNYRQRLQDRWFELRSAEFSEIRLVELVGESFDELNNYQIIDTENRIWKNTVNLNTEETYIASWIASRLDFLDGYFSD